MLVLCRKLGQQMVIDGRIRLMVTTIRGSQVWLGISEPPDGLIHRPDIQTWINELAEPASAETASNTVVSSVRSTKIVSPQTAQISRLSSQCGSVLRPN